METDKMIYKEGEPIVDMFGNRLEIGDTVCFTLSMRKDDKPIVKAKVAGFIYGKPDECGQCTNWIVLGDYTKNRAYEWAELEKKVIKKVISHRAVKCY